MIDLFDPSATSVWQRLLHAVHARIESLGLDGIPSEHIMIGQIEPENLCLVPGVPGVLIRPMGAEETTRGGTIYRDEVRYPILVSFVDSILGPGTDCQEFVRATDRRLGWRERVRRAFVNQRIWTQNDQDCIVITDVRPGPVLDERRWRDRNTWLSELTIWPTSWETRGC